MSLTRHILPVAVALCLLGASPGSSAPLRSPANLTGGSPAAPAPPSRAAVMDLWLATSLALVVLYCRRRRQSRNRGPSAPVRYRAHAQARGALGGTGTG